MNEKELTKRQTEMHDKIFNHAKENNLIKQKPLLMPIYDGVADIKAYISSNPKIMWILKEPYDDFTSTGKARGGDWYFTEHFKNTNVWKDQDMWKLMIQINYAIRNNLKWKELDYIENNSEMAEELKKTAYINISKMPANTISPNDHIRTCYAIWKKILFEQIDIYKPDVIIFGYTFQFFKEDFKITDKAIPTISGQWNADVYKKDNMILIDAFHPSRKGGEDSGHDYVTCIINAYKKASKK
ncbi:hypothetical protein [Treponema sp.]|uniref:hypothetical protein n=1 Tax=Treponema sp. TaxID=166 RepID=UPI00389097CB